MRNHSQIRILLVTGSLNQGGAEFQLLTLARMLQEHGFDVEVLALTDYDYFMPYVRKHKLRYTCIENRGSNVYRVWKAVRLIIQRRPTLVISYIKKVSQVAILARIFSGFAFKLISSERTALIRPRHDLFYFNLTRFVNLITVNSSSKLSYIRQRFPFLRRKAVFMPNIIDYRRFEAVSSVPAQDGVIRLSFIGRISPEKNLLNLVKAVGMLTGRGYRLRLTLSGAASNKLYLGQLQELIRREQLEHIVLYTGPVGQVEEVYRHTDLLCLVSVFEGFSNVLSEALCSGIPVLASDIEENRYLVEDTVNGFLVPPGDAAAIAAGIERFLQLDPAAISIMAASNRNKARAIFDEDHIYQQYVDLFRKTGLQVKEPIAKVAGE